MNASADSVTQVRLMQISHETENINSCELVSPISGDLTPFTAGSIVKAASRNSGPSGAASQQGGQVMICCSSSRSASLTLGI
jgi:hypothetical protein